MITHIVPDTYFIVLVQPQEVKLLWGNHDWRDEDVTEIRI